MTAFEVFRSRRVAIQLPLGFASGLPFLLTGTTLGTWLTLDGISLATVGFFAWASLPYSLKFLWAPLIDRFRLPFLGRRRGWLLVLQLVLAAAIALLGRADPRTDLAAVAGLAVALSFFSATLDIVVDAFRVDTLLDVERAAGSAAYILGYRIGMLAAGAVALILADHVAWSTVYAIMAAGMAVGIITTLLVTEPETATPPRTIAAAIVEPFRDLLARPGIAPVLAFIALYRFGTLLLEHMKQPFFVKLGFTPSEIGTVNKGFGLAALIAGGLVAGAWVPRIGLRRALLGFGAAAALAHLAFVALALSGKQHGLLVLCVVVDSFCSGLAIAPLDAFGISLCRRAYSATQYAVLTSLVGVAGRLVGGASGVLADGLGWPLFFVATFAAGLPALALLALRRVSTDT